MKAEPNQPLQLHIGCGDVYIPGFIHIDIRPLKHVDLVCEVDELDAFADSTVELIYNCHVLEHIQRERVPGVLREWHRVLKPGGILRTATPDFEAIAARYCATKNLEELMGLLFGRQDYPFNFHYQIFDFARLERLLLQGGFRRVYRYDWRQTIHGDYDDFSQAYLPHMDKNNGMLMSLNVEAAK